MKLRVQFALVFLLFLSNSCYADISKFLSFPIERQRIIGNGWNYGYSDHIAGYDIRHNAIDITAPKGTTVLAPADGYAMYDCHRGPGGDRGCVDWPNYSTGRMVIIRHDEKDTNDDYIYSLYGHLDSSSALLLKKNRFNIDRDLDVTKDGWVRVVRGQAIGTVGDSGKQSWAHLHLVVFSGSYNDSCYVGEDCSSAQGVTAFDPYGLYAATNVQSKGEDESRDYYPPVVFKNKSNDFYVDPEQKSRTSGKKYSGLKSRRLWITDPPFPALKIMKKNTSDASSKTYQLDGVGYSLPDNADVRVSKCLPEKGHIDESNMSCETIDIPSSDLYRNGSGFDFEIPVDYLGHPFLVEIFDADGEKITEASYPFVDVSPKDWYAFSVNKIFEEEKLNGYVDESGIRLFKPEKSVTRAEFLKLVVEIGGFECNQSKDIPYTDVPSKEWFHKYVNIGLCNELLDVSNKTTFRPVDPILRSESIILIYRSKNVADIDIQKLGCNAQANNYSSIPSFNDVGPQGYFSEAACVMKGKDWLTGYSVPSICGDVGVPCLKPENEITRAEAVSVLMKVFRDDK